MSDEAYVKLSKNLTFLSDSIYNATVVDGSTNQVLYQISTPNKMGKHSTTVANADGVVVAEFVRHWGVNKDEVVLHGQTMKVHEWLPSKSSHVWYVPTFSLNMTVRKVNIPSSARVIGPLPTGSFITGNLARQRAPLR